MIWASFGLADVAVKQVKLYPTAVDQSVHSFRMHMYANPSKGSKHCNLSSTSVNIVIRSLSQEFLKLSTLRIMLHDFSPKIWGPVDEDPPDFSVTGLVHLGKCMVQAAAVPKDSVQLETVLISPFFL